MTEPHPPRRPPWALLARIGVSVGILAWLGRGMNWSQIGGQFTTMRWGYWVGAVGLLFICQGLSALRWQLMSRPLGFTEPFRRFLSIYFVGMFFNLLLPTSVGGDVVRGAYLNARSGRKLQAALCVLVDRISGLMVLLWLACFASLASPVAIPGQLFALVWTAGVSALAGLIALPFVATLLERVAERFDGLAGRWLGRVARTARGLADALALYRSRPALLATTTGLSLLIQGLNVVLVWMVGLALRLEVPVVYYGVAVPMVTLLTLLPVSLNGMGVREGGMAVFLAPAGVAAGDAVTLAFLWFFVQTTASSAGAFAYLFGRFPRLETPANDLALGGRAVEGRTGQYRAAA